MEWQPIETAPKTGEVFQAKVDRCGIVQEYPATWGIARKPSGFALNGGKPWWISPCATKLVPTPTAWKSEP